MGHNPSEQSSEEAAAAPGRQPRLRPAALPDGGGSPRIIDTDAGARPCRAKAGDLSPGTQARLAASAEALGGAGGALGTPFFGLAISRGAPRPGPALPGLSRPHSASRYQTRIATDSDSPGKEPAKRRSPAGAHAPYPRPGTGPAAGAEGAAAAASTATYRLQPAPRRRD